MFVDGAINCWSVGANKSNGPERYQKTYQMQTASHVFQHHICHNNQVTSPPHRIIGHLLNEVRICGKLKKHPHTHLLLNQFLLERTNAPAANIYITDVMDACSQHARVPSLVFINLSHAVNWVAMLMSLHIVSKAADNTHAVWVALVILDIDVDKFGCS